MCPQFPDVGGGGDPDPGLIKPEKPVAEGAPAVELVTGPCGLLCLQFPDVGGRGDPDPGALKLEELVEEVRAEELVPTARQKRRRGECLHGQQKDMCQECGVPTGKQKGQRKRRRDSGTDDRAPGTKGPAKLAKCPHGRRKGTCKECGGSAICPHGRQKSKCKECGGSGVCPHGREKRRCKEWKE